MAFKESFAGTTNATNPYIELEMLDEDNNIKKYRQRAKQGWELVQVVQDPEGFVSLLIGRTHAAKTQATANREAKKAERQKKKGKKTTAKKTTAKKKK